MTIPLAKLEALGVGEPQQITWLLYHKTADLSLEEATGILLFDMLKVMSYNDAQASFVVTAVIAEKATDRIVQLVDRDYLVIGDVAFDTAQMGPMKVDELPDRPLISVAIALARLQEHLTAEPETD